MKIKTMLTAALLCVLAFAVTGASVAQAQKMIVDVDKKFDFATFKSFGWAPGQIAPKETTSKFIVDAIEKELRSRGLVRNDADPDIRIAVMAAADIDLQGVGPTWNNEVYRSWGGYGNAGALMNVTKGTLLIDLVETESKYSVWRGVAKDVFVAPPSNDPVKDANHMQSLVNKTVTKLFKKYPVKQNK
jgi:hypothetical protein